MIILFCLKLTETVKNLTYKMATESEMNQKTQLELEKDLVGAKHALLDVQHQLQMAEKVKGTVVTYWPDLTLCVTCAEAFVTRPFPLTSKELEKKLSETGAFKNLKRMLTAKNEQIKSLRNQLRSAGLDAQ